MEMIRNSLDLTGRYRIGDGSRDGWHTYRSGKSELEKHKDGMGGSMGGGSMGGGGMGGSSMGGGKGGIQGGLPPLERDATRGTLLERDAPQNSGLTASQN
eukprot:scaffold50551_cov57-Phaeocystis_antarctica.AAC.1